MAFGVAKLHAKNNPLISVVAYVAGGGGLEGKWKGDWSLLNRRGKAGVVLYKARDPSMHQPITLQCL